MMGKIFYSPAALQMRSSWPSLTITCSVVFISESSTTTITQKQQLAKLSRARIILSAKHRNLS